MKLSFFSSKQSKRLIDLENKNIRLESELSDLRAKLAAIDKELLELKVNLSQDLGHISVAGRPFSEVYSAFEQEFRGSEATIKDRLTIYVPHLRRASQAAPSLPILDLGCGRGELLEILQEQGIPGIGIDNSSHIVAYVRKKGLEVKKADVVTYLREQPSNTLAGITALHVIEHLPLPLLVQLLEQAYRAIVPGGYAIFETPNPATLVVGSHTFYIDPTHKRPLPSELLQFLLRQVGFSTELLLMHDAIPYQVDSGARQETVHRTIYGPADYAVVASKNSD